MRRYVHERYSTRAVRAEMSIQPLFLTDTEAGSMVTRVVAYDAQGQVCEYDLAQPFFHQERVYEQLIRTEVRNDVSLHDQIATIDRAYWTQETDMVSFVDWYDLPTSRREWNIDTPPLFCFVVVPISEQEATDTTTYRVITRALQHVVDSFMRHVRTHLHKNKTYTRDTILRKKTSLP